jgi:hypothetical protein
MSRKDTTRRDFTGPTPLCFAVTAEQYVTNLTDSSLGFSFAGIRTLGGQERPPVDTRQPLLKGQRRLMM